MTLFSLLIKSLCLLLLSLPLMLLVLAIGHEPAAPIGGRLTEGEIEEIQQLLIDNDPRLLMDQDEQVVRLSESEVNALLAYLATTVPELESVSSRAELLPGRALLALSSAIPATPFGRYVNLTVLVREEGDRLALDQVRAGSLTIPGEWLSPLLRLGRFWLADDSNYRLASTLFTTVDKVSLTEGTLILRLNWQEDKLTTIGDQARRLFFDAEERSRLLDYQQRIAAIAAALPPQRGSANLNEFLRPLFATAQVNSEQGADPMAENRTLFIALTVYLTELRLEHLLGPPGESPYPRPRPLNVRVDGRLDLAQHIVGSAALAASAGAEVADILSIYKEVHDSRYRTGFSFSDITANQVGSALGHLATAGDSEARQVQRLLSSSQQESDYMPPVGGFDGISEQEFINQYGDRGSPRYQQRLREIRAAITARPVFQAFETTLEFDTLY